LNGHNLAAAPAPAVPVPAPAVPSAAPSAAPRTAVDAVATPSQLLCVLRIPGPVLILILVIVVVIVTLRFFVCVVGSVLIDRSATSSRTLATATLRHGGTGSLEAGGIQQSHELR